MDWTGEVRERLEPVAGELPVTAPGLVIALLVAAAAVLWFPAWRRLRLVVTLVHELGHAAVGLVSGRRFTGFVVRGDASGHAVTVGRERGFARVATTWAGYPAPAAAGLLLIWCAARGSAAPLLGITLVVLVVVATQVRSLLTAWVMLLAIGGIAALWWLRNDTVHAYVALVAGCVLLAGAWRGLADVTRRGRGADDHAVLAGLTRIPRVVWLASWAVCCAWATVLAGRLALTLL